MNNKFKYNIVICLVFTILFFNLPTVYADEKDKTNDIDPYYCVLCDHLDEDDPLYEKEKQFDLKVSIIKSIYGSSIDPVALVGTVLKEYNSSATLYKEEYDEEFNSNRYSNALREYKNSELGSTLQLSKKDIEKVAENAKIDLLTITAIIMADSNHLNTYNDVCYRDALAGNSLVGNTNNSGAFVFLMNGLYCEVYDIVENPIQFVIDLFSGDNYSVSSASAKNRSVLTKNVCENGFIGGIYSDVLNIKDEAARNQQKLVYADDIMTYINQYRLLHGQDISNNACATNNASSTGSYADWKQYDNKWGNLEMGGVPSVRNYGCLVTSVSIQVARSGTQLGSLPSGYSEFNPGAFVTSLNQNGGFNSNAEFTWRGYNTIAPHWKDGGSVSGLSVTDDKEIANIISKELETGVGEGNKYQKFIVLNISYVDNSSVFHPQHWIAVNEVDNGVLKTFDPGSSASTLSDAYPKWTVHGYHIFYADDVLLGQTGTSNSSSNCSGGDDLNRFAAFTASFEGHAMCNYHGQGENTGYQVTLLANDSGGLTTGFGLTAGVNSSAQRIGYTNFLQELNEGCTNKQKTEELLMASIEDQFGPITDGYLEASGVTVNAYERYALISLDYGTPGNSEPVIKAMKKYGKESEQVFEEFRTTFNVSKAIANGWHGLMKKKLSEYELFMTGNYEADASGYYGSLQKGLSMSKAEVMSHWPTKRSHDLDLFGVVGSSAKRTNTVYGTDGLVCIDGQAVSADDAGNYDGLPIKCARKNATTRVLFIGNSKTKINDISIPDKFKEMAKSKGYDVEVTTRYNPGYALTYQYDHHLSVLDESYDCVVLQEQTDAYMSRDISTFQSGVQKYVNKVKSKNPDVISYIRQTWTLTTDNNVGVSYKNAEKVAQNTGTYLITDGKAFDRSKSSYSNIKLISDDRHQTHEGAYLSAACIFKTLYGESPVGISYTGGIKSEDAEKLQKIADSVCEVPKTSSSGMGRAVVDLALKQLPEGGAKFWNYVAGGDFINGSLTPWCACFVTWVLDHATYNNVPIKNKIDVRAGGKAGTGAGGYLEYAYTHGMLKYNDSCSMYTGKNGSKYTPKPGDLVIFSWASDWNGVASSDAPGHDHIGIVEKVENGVLHTIEGNSSNAVRQRTYSLNDCRVSAFINWEK